MVRRPEASASPKSTAARAAPASCPRYDKWTTAATSSAQSIVTGEAVLTTTTVRGLAAATRRTRSTWWSGRSMVGVSKPSDSGPSRPTTTMATSASPAAATARSAASGWVGGRASTDKPVTAIGLSAATASTSPTTSYLVPASSSMPDSTCRVRRPTGPPLAGSAGGSTRDLPSTNSRTPPAPNSEKVHGPETSGVKAVVMRAEKASAGRPGTGSPIEKAIATFACSVRAGVPARSPAAKYSMRTGPAAVSSLVSVSGLAIRRPASGADRGDRRPASKATMPAPARSWMPCNGVIT